MVTMFCGVAINGIYSISYKIPSLITAISGIFTSAWQISAVEDFGSKESIKFFSRIYCRYSALFILLTSIVIFFIKFIADILFSKAFYDAWKYASILIIASMFQSLCSFLGSIYTTAMKTRMIFVTTMLGAMSNIAFNLLLIPSCGAYGAAIATLMSYMIVWIVRLLNSRKIIKLQIQVKKDIICYLIIGIQCFYMIMGKSYVYIVNTICLIILLFV
mgnify:CR=1 FL=1